MGVKIFSIGKSGGTSVLILVCVEVSVGVNDYRILQNSYNES